MAMSEPDYGTDVLGMATNAVLQDDGNWCINGRKMWITNGVIDEDGTPADIVWLYARTGTTDRGRPEISHSSLRKDAGLQIRSEIIDKLECALQTQQNWCLKIVSSLPKIWLVRL